MLFKNQQRVAGFFDYYSAILGPVNEQFDENYIKTNQSIIKKFDFPDQCYAIVNLKTQLITWCYGFDKYLGYPAKTIIHQPMDILSDMVHPFIRETDKLYNAAFLKMHEARADRKLMQKTRYNVNVPLIKYNGTYMMVKRMTMPFSFDDKGRLLSVLNAYCVTSPYHTQALRPRLFEESRRAKWFLPMLYKTAAELIPAIDNNFTPAEFRYIDEYLNTSVNDLNIRYKFQIAKKLGIAMKGTTGVMERNIRIKICKLFQYPHAYINHSHTQQPKDIIKCLPDFSSFKQGVHFLNKSGILEVLKNICSKKI